jgi:hypothetical protein
MAGFSGTILVMTEENNKTLVKVTGLICEINQIQVTKNKNNK